MIHYEIKKYSTACKTFSHLNSEGVKVYKNKKKYKDPHEAKLMCEKINKEPGRIHKVKHYFCKECRHYHIGKTNEVINNTIYE
jgi:hypothetical protein